MTTKKILVAVSVLLRCRPREDIVRERLLELEPQRYDRIRRILLRLTPGVGPKGWARALDELGLEELVTVREAKKHEAAC